MLSQDTILYDKTDLNFQAEEDYKNYEDKILILIHWMESHSLNHRDRGKANYVFTTWLVKTPYPVILYNFSLLKYTTKNPEFLNLFFAGYTKYALRNPEEEDARLKGNLAGINALIDFYIKGEAFGVKKDEMMEKLLQKKQEGKLERLIKRQLGY